MIPTWWARLWGIAIIAHVIGNPRFGQVITEPTALGVVTLLCLIGGVLLVLEPTRLAVLIASAGLVVAVAWLEAPALSNHWQLAALVSLALVVAVVAGRGADWFFPVARWMFLGFYSWAAFAKLNEGFLDPAVSCGVVYANQALESWGLPVIGAGSSLAWAPVVGSALVELSVPVLLAIRRTRMVGVFVGVVFHGLISLDLAQHFYDFTAVLIPLILLFAPSLGERIAGGVRREFVRPLALVAGGVGLAGLLPLGTVTYGVVQYGAFVVWIPVLAWVWGRAFSALRQPGEDVSFHLDGVAAMGFVGLVLLIGTLPYLEVRTATSWNMYANLYTVGGESNHLLIRSTIPLTDHQERIVEILETEDEALGVYADSGYGLVERQLLDYLADKPEVTVQIRVDGLESELAGGNEEDRLGLFARKLQVLRAVDLESPPRCQRTWLPAH